MPLSTVGGVGNISRTYTLSFDEDGKGIPAWSNLQEIYERMYGASSPAAQARLREKQNLLDEIYGDAKDFRRKLGKEDQATLDEYLAAISGLEKKIENDRLWAQKGAAAAPPEMNLEIEFTDVENYIRAMYDLMYLAFKADITRVATYQIASEGGTAPTNNLSKQIGMGKDLHQLSHSAAKSDDGFKDWGLWDQFVARQLAYFINRLKETKEGDGFDARPLPRLPGGRDFPSPRQHELPPHSRRRQTSGPQNRPIRRLRRREECPVESLLSESPTRWTCRSKSSETVQAFR